MNGYEKLLDSVKYDCTENKSCGCFNQDGCNVEGARIGKYGEDGYKSCFHKYCDKFKWVIERAKQYEEKLGIPWNEILDSWEEDRTYWYMNYYQDCNQPQITSDNVRVFDTLNDFKESAKQSEYICPSCGKVTTNPYECTECNWKVYGFLGDLGKGVFIYLKDVRKGQTIFMPRAWSGNK